MKFESKTFSFFPLKSSLAALVALFLALMLIFVKETNIMIKNIIPWVTIIILILILVVIVFQIAGVDVFSENVLGKEGKRMVLYVIFGAVMFVVFWNVGIVFNEEIIDAANNSQNIEYLSGRQGFAKMALAIVFNPLVFPTFIFLVVCGVLVWYLLQE